MYTILSILNSSHSAFDFRLFPVAKEETEHMGLNSNPAFVCSFFRKDNILPLPEWQFLNH